MSRTPADLDAMMWDIAERHDAQAATDFANRFPDLALDMRKRMEMVAGMRAMRSNLTPGFVPAFTPKYMVRPRPKWARFGPPALGLAALAAASFYITQNLLTPLPMPVPAASVDAPLIVHPPKEPTVVLPPPPKAKSEIDPESARPYAAKPEASEPLPAHVTMTDVPLQTAMKALAKQAGLKMEIPPDFPNPVVKVDLTGQPGMEMLQQLGAQNGFTVFSEGGGRVLAIPATRGD